ncbi:hypothetical protein GF319_02960 [Candidatus Bathyarchaeota archaeon]|nr:hypothetical protein [Candidatus Bathyarchaeota archaeon]
MRLNLISHSTNIETLIATSMLTTTSGAQPSTLFERLKERPEKVNEVVGRVELQHGNILEHNRLIWEIMASEDELLQVLLNLKFFNVTKVQKDKWLISGNLRSVVEYSNKYSDDFRDQIIKSIKDISPRIYEFIEGSK